MQEYIIIGVFIVLALYIIIVYNSLIRRKNETVHSFGSVDVMLKKRYDLIPNLVETVKQYMIHEATILSDVTKMRAGFTNDLSNDEELKLHNKMSKRLNNLMLSVENYPDLKASRNFILLQSSWNEAEEQISAARRYYNSAVTHYNNLLQSFPSNIIAGLFGFKAKEVFEIDEIERENIDAKELFKK